MTIAEPTRSHPGAPVPARDNQNGLAGLARRLSGAVQLLGRSAASLVARLPGAMQTTQAGAQGATSALQALPDPALRWLAATSVGVGAGLSLAGAPRVVVAAGVAPALFAGAAILLRPVKLEETTDMTDQQIKGKISKAQGKLEEELGELTGDKRQEARGKLRQVKGAIQEGVGDVEAAVHVRTGKA